MAWDAGQPPRRLADLGGVVSSLAAVTGWVLGGPAAGGDGHWWDALNPFYRLGSVAEKVGADAYTNVMLGFWKCGLMVLKFVLNLIDAFTTPDLSAQGPGRAAYATTFWMAGALVGLLALVQVGVAALRRDGRSLGTLAIGAGKFIVVAAGWLSYGTAVVAACGGLTTAMMGSLMGVRSWGEWDPWGGFAADDVTDAGVATLLGILGVLLLFAAVGHLLVMLARAGSLIVLAAVTPVAAAGQVSELGQVWLGKSLRWFHAAALTPVLMVLVIGIGVQVSTSTVVAASAKAAGIPTQLASALPGVTLILISCVAPLALFKLLAFTDPSTASGSAMRAGMAAQGGLSGLLSGGGSAGSSAAGSTDGAGRAQGEAGAEDATSQRFAGTLSSIGGLGGKAVGAMAAMGSAATAIGSDLTNQMGVGAHSYQPDFSGTGGGGSRGGARGSDPAGESADDARSNDSNTPAGSGSEGSEGGGLDPSHTLAPATPWTGATPGAAMPSSPAGGGPGAADKPPTQLPGGGAGGAGGSGGAGAGGAADAAAVAAI